MEKKDNEKADSFKACPKSLKDLAAWAEDDYRSINGQIEFLLSECVRKRKKPRSKGGGYARKFLSGEITPEEYHTWLKNRKLSEK